MVELLLIYLVSIPAAGLNMDKDTPKKAAAVIALTPVVNTLYALFSVFCDDSETWKY